MKPEYAKGDRVRATANHMPGMKGMEGVVSIVRTEPAYYGITFDEPMDGMKSVHKWLAEDEIEPGKAKSVDRDGARQKWEGSDLLSQGLVFKGINEELREASFVASTAAVDSHDEIVEQDWQLDRYKANPVVLYAHQSRELPIGHCVQVGVVRGALECTVRFETAEANPKADQVYRMVKSGSLRAVSVGFIPGDVRMETRSGRDVIVLSNNALHEISVVPIPSNPEALAKVRAKALAQEPPTPPAALDGSPIEKEKNAMNTATDSKPTEKALSDAQEKAANLEKDLSETRAKLATETAAKSVLTAERDTAVERAKAAETKLVDKEVSELVGTKITPAEKDGLVELAAIAPVLFEKQMKAIRARADMGILGDSKLGTEKEAARSSAGPTDFGHGEDLAAAIDASATASA
jgi:HK97 family phage prohead protease